MDTGPDVPVATQTRGISYQRRDGSRFWEVREGQDLIAVTVYKRGAAEVARRLTALTSTPIDPERGLDDPERVWERLQHLRTAQKEHFVALYLNARNQFLHQETVSIGTLTASLVHPREVFAPALEHRAARLIVAHNHPSGDLRPSPEDRETTRRIAEAGRIMGIELVDHVLVTSNGWFSFRQGGCL